MESKNQKGDKNRITQSIDNLSFGRSRDRCVKILSWTMKVAAIVCVILSILGWIAVYLLTLRISNNTFDIVRVEQACAKEKLAHFPNSTVKDNGNCRKTGVPIRFADWEVVNGRRARKLIHGVLYRVEKGDNIIEEN
ncbi:hypothetical protein PENTCL1PPCAC_18145 [Pristionchus entomophagus]|uniref:Uncharacterized protein n=1 Tax=Pristionchus entomophagus TaxID=358040 RepID=A0AAV5TNZ4_9BILA|nr:hypothetical protein PENTCL1PPCAC_18145 [Pristionchus entomophagus]